MATIGQYDLLVGEVGEYFYDVIGKIKRDEIDDKRFEDDLLLLTIKGGENATLTGSTDCKLSTIIKLLRQNRVKVLQISQLDQSLIAWNIEKMADQALETWLKESLPYCNYIGFIISRNGYDLCYYIYNVQGAKARVSMITYTNVIRNWMPSSFTYLILHALQIKGESLTHRLITTEENLTPYFCKEMIKLVLEFLFD